MSESSERVAYANVDGADEVFTAEFLGYFVAAHDKFVERVHDLRAKRAEVLRRALEDGVMPAHPPVSEINTADWSVPPVPEDPAPPRHRDHGAGVNHQHVHQRAEPRPRGRARGRRPGRRRRRGRASPGRHGDGGPQPARRGGADAGVPRRGERSPLHDPGRRAAVLHAPRARAAPRRVRVDHRRQARLRRDTRHRADGVPLRTGPDGARSGPLFLFAEDGVRRRGGILARLLRLQQGASGHRRRGRDTCDPAGRVAPRGIPDGGDAPRARLLRRGG